MIEGTSTESKIVRLKRMKCIIYPIDVQLDNKVYTFEELFNLIMGNSIVIVDTTTESEEMSEEQFTIGVNSGEIVLNKTALCSIGLDDKAFSDFVSSANEEERKLWYAMNMFFCKYLREDKLKFESTNQVCVIKGDEEFRNTVNHINEIISTIKKRYKRSKKTIPNLFSNIFDLVDREIREAEKEFYTSNSRNRIKDE